MNRLDKARQVAVVKALVEGNSIRSTVRLTGVAKNTIQKLILELGAACGHVLSFEKGDGLAEDLDIVATVVRDHQSGHD